MITKLEPGVTGKMLKRMRELDRFPKIQQLKDVYGITVSKDIYGQPRLSKEVISKLKEFDLWWVMDKLRTISVGKSVVWKNCSTRNVGFRYIQRVCEQALKANSMSTSEVVKILTLLEEDLKKLD